MVQKWYAFSKKFRFWILIFSQASRMQSGTLSWCQAAATSHSSSQPRDHGANSGTLQSAVLPVGFLLYGPLSTIKVARLSCDVY